MLGSDTQPARRSHSQTVANVLRSSLTCQLACIACAEAQLRIAVLEHNSQHNSSLVRACLKCVEVCTALKKVLGRDGYPLNDYLDCLALCIDACAAGEAECLASGLDELYIQRCRAACAKVRESCRQLLGSVSLQLHSPQ
jgi:hypothetical protein